MKRLFLIFVLSAIAVSSAVASDWPQFRGESGSAVSGDANVPEHWDTNANLLWKAKLPGPGASSPLNSSPLALGKQGASAPCHNGRYSPTQYSHGGGLCRKCAVCSALY